MHLDTRKIIFALIAFFAGFAIAKELNNSSIEAPKIQGLNQNKEQEIVEEEEIDLLAPRTINDIILTRIKPNKYLTDEAILSCMPYRKGERYSQAKTSMAIKNIFELEEPFSYFQDIKILGEYPNNQEIILHVVTYEKPELESVVFEGNNKLSASDIEEKLHLEEIHALDENDKEIITMQLKKLYKEKNYHLADVQIEVQPQPNNKIKLLIKICENEKSLIKRVYFKGNNCISSKKLHSLIFTREDWIFGILDKSGSLKTEMLEGDKHIIENYYKTQGFLTAKVNNADIKMDPQTKQFEVTFTITEGDKYTIKSVKADGNELVSEEFILERLPLQPGNLYSAKDIRDAIEGLRLMWGQYGYAFADVEPIIIPNSKDKTVTIDLRSELGEKVFINRINILGNKKTKDKIIRRKISLKEGSLLSTPEMENSKSRVESLSYFDPRDGVVWKINRIDNKWADLDLIIKEARTGRAGLDFTYGGSPIDIGSASSSFKVGGYVTDSNWLGSGIALATSAHWSKQEWDFNFGLTDNWFLDKPIFSNLDINIVKSDYSEQLKTVQNFSQRVASAYYGLGFSTSPACWMNEATFVWRAGIENISQSCPPKVEDPDAEGSDVFQIMLNRMFQAGKVVTFEQRVAQDFRNNNIHPSQGFQWSAGAKIGHGIQSSKFGYGKLEVDASYYTTLIAPRQLVLGIHAFFGIIGKTGCDKTIPYKELFHIGGQASVRGFEYGQIGPMFMGDSIGGKKAFFWNTELVFPISQDFSMKGAVFYDGGAGWDAPDLNLIPTNLQTKFLRNNNFEYRHSVGFGIRMLKPQPVKIDWAFKLDKKKNEKTSELHLSAYREF